MDRFAVFAGAIAIMLSAIVRLIRTDAAWKAVDEGYAGADHVRDLTGVVDRSALQDVVGPPTMDGVFHVTRQQVLNARTLTGRLMGDVKLDALSILAAVLVMLAPSYGPLGVAANGVFLLALGYQLAGWGATSLLMGGGKA